MLRLNKLMNGTLQGVTCLIPYYMIQKQSKMQVVGVDILSYNDGVVDRRQR